MYVCYVSILNVYFLTIRLSQDITDKQEARTKNSRRRMTVEVADIDHINDRNAAFNKKIKRAFDKYTVEIRQNLERGTAV